MPIWITIPADVEVTRKAKCPYCLHDPGEEPITVTVKFAELFETVMDDPKWGATYELHKRGMKIEALFECKEHPDRVLLDEKDGKALQGIVGEPTRGYMPEVMKQATTLLEAIMDAPDKDPDAEEKKKAKKNATKAEKLAAARALVEAAEAEETPPDDAPQAGAAALEPDAPAEDVPEAVEA